MISFPCLMWRRFHGNLYTSSTAFKQFQTEADKGSYYLAGYLTLINPRITLFAMCGVTYLMNLTF